MTTAPAHRKRPLSRLFAQPPDVPINGSHGQTKTSKEEMQVRPLADYGSRWLPYVVLGSLPIVWGTTAPMCKYLNVKLSTFLPSSFVNASLQSATLICLLVNKLLVSFMGREVGSGQVTRDQRRVARVGVELGMYMLIGFSLSLAGMSRGVSAGTSAFLGQLCTVITPILEGFVFGRFIPPRIWVASVMSVGGVAMMAADSPGAAAAAELTRPHLTGSLRERIMYPFVHGEALCALAAFCFATHDVRLAQMGGSLPPKSSVPLAIAKQATGVLGAVLLALVAGDLRPSNAQGWGGVLPALLASREWVVLALLMGFQGVQMAVTMQMQNWAHPKVGASMASVFYATSPLYAAAWASIILSESFGRGGLVGAVTFLAAIGVALVPDLIDGGAKWATTRRE